MDAALVGRTWDSLAGQHTDFVREFYSRFFKRHPQYLPYFPRDLDGQMKKMLRTLSIVARTGGDTVAEPHVHRVGAHHRRYGLRQQDLDNFKRVFLEVLAERCADQWSEDCVAAWTHVFDAKIIPMMMRGLEESSPPH